MTGGKIVKFKYINYKPYEYELLQEELDQLGKEGYDCNDLSMISIFRKKDHPIYYKVEFYLSEEKEKYKRDKDIAKYYERHTEFGFFPIYSKNGMYVFSGNEDHTFKQNEYSNGVKLADKRIPNIFLILCGVFVLTVALYYCLFAAQSVTAFLTYGKVISYIGILALCVSFIYRLCNDYHFSNNVKKGIYSYDKIKKTHKIAISSLLISLVLIFGGLCEDMINIKDINYDHHPYIQFKDLGYNGQSEINTSSSHGFIIKNAYSTYEAQGDHVLYTKEYDFNSVKQAELYIETLIKRPSDIISTKIEKHDDMYYGYFNDTLNTVIFIKDHKVIIVTYSLPINDDMIKTIKNFYL